MGGLFLGHYNIGTYVSGHVLVCMPDKSTELPIIRETIVKYNAFHTAIKKYLQIPCFMLVSL